MNDAVRHRDDHVRMDAIKVSCERWDRVRLAKACFELQVAPLDETASRKFGQSVLTETLKRALTDRDKADSIDAVWRGLCGNSFYEGRPAEQSHDEMPIKKLIAHKTVYTGLRSGFG